MTDKKSKKSTKTAKRKKAALKEYIALGQEYATLHHTVKTSQQRMNEIGPVLRLKAKQAGLDKTKDAPQVTDEFRLETRFSTGIERYDVDRLRKRMREEKLSKAVKACFTKEVTYKFDKKEFERLEEAGEIPQSFIEEMEEGDEPLYWIEDRTPSLYVLPVEGDE